MEQPDLLQYGFSKINETEKSTQYEGHGYTVYIYHYLVKTFEGKEIAHNTFLVTSQERTGRLRPISELSDWLFENKIERT